MWETLSAALVRFIQEWGEVAIFVIFLLEESGLPLRLPGEVARHLLYGVALGITYPMLLLARRSARVETPAGPAALPQLT
jgi:hypothetical protein